MGIIFSRFRKKESTKEILSKIHDEITQLQEAKTDTEQSRRKLGRYIIYVWILFIAASVSLYFYYAPPTLREKLLSAIPPLIVIFMIFGTKSCFNYLYRWKLYKNDKKMKLLSERKAKILEDVMETETYKVAKEILEIYSPETLRNNLSLSLISTPQKKPVQKAAFTPISQPANRFDIFTPQIATPYIIKDSCSEVRRRFVPTQSSSHAYPNTGLRMNRSGLDPAKANLGPNSAKISFPLTTPVRAKPNLTPARLYDNVVAGEAGAMAPPGPPMPRPILPRERGVFERFVEVLVGDGPSNRYALICRGCESHNGMALKEEFEYMSYRCAYCHYWNAPKKQRPTAPKIANVPTLTSHLQQVQQMNTAEASGKDDSQKDSPTVNDPAVIEKETSPEDKTESETTPHQSDPIVHQSDPIVHQSDTEDQNKPTEEDCTVEERSDEPKIE